MGFLDDTVIDVPCPGCGHKSKKKIGWFKAHTQMTCAGCRQVILLNDDGLQRSIKKVDNAIAAFRKAFFGKHLYQRARIDKRQMPILRRSNVQGYR